MNHMIDPKFRLEPCCAQCVYFTDGYDIKAVFNSITGRCRRYSLAVKTNEGGVLCPSYLKR